jgi:two-component system, chemotaxis family, sensor histidine kinase and response regulator PixL
MSSFDSEIHDQAYQFFIQESVEFLQILETGLMDLTQDHGVPKIHELMRAAHSIKGGAASVGLNCIKQLSYQLEDCLRALYQDTVVIDRSLEDLLLQALDCLKEPLLQQIETGEHDEAAALAQAEPIYELLVIRLGDALANVDAAMPTSAELGIDIVLAIFAGDVQNGIQRIQQVLSNPNQQELVGEIRAQVEVFVGVGELVNLPGWVAIAKAILAALQQSPGQARAIAEVAIADLQAAQQLVLDGDRAIGGAPSAALLAYGVGAVDSVPAVLDRAADALAIGDGLAIDEMVNSGRLGDAAMPFDPMAGDWAVGETDFANIPSEQLDELFALAMDPEDMFGGMPLDEHPELTTVPFPVSEPLPAAFDMTAMPPIAAFADPTSADISGDDFANLDAFFDLALTDAAFDPAMPVADLGDAPTVIVDLANVAAIESAPELEITSAIETATTIVPLVESPIVSAVMFDPILCAEVDETVIVDEMVVDEMVVDEMVMVDTPIAATEPPISWDTVIRNLDQQAAANEPADPEPVRDREAQNRHVLATSPTVPEQAFPVPLAEDAAIDAVIRNLLENADRGIYQVIAAPAPLPRLTGAAKRAAAAPAATKGTSPNNVVRVDLARLEQINNRVGAMVTQENRTMQHNQQLQATAKAMLQRFSQFEAVARQIGVWSDQSQKVQAKLSQHPSIGPRTAAAVTIGSSSADSSAGWQDNFDPLQMDTYGELYGFAQEMLELMAQMGEGMRDLTQLSQVAGRSQHQQQGILKQLRDDLLWARMLPLDDLLQRFPRMMRDLSNRYGKPVKLELSGTHTLVDKSILQSLYDPLVHLLRNAFDHGIELPEVRVAQGKPAQATIAIRAYHRGNQTHIDIVDDGGGIDPERIRAKVVENQLVTADAAAKLTPDQLYSYLFAAGFSTAGKVSELSGRGVGLDAVQSQVASLKGTVSLTSSLGQGSTFSLQLPLTLTVATLLIFTVQSCMMAAPIDALKAIVAVPKGQIRMEQGRKIYYWDDQPVPLCPRSQFLQSYPLPRQLPPDFKPMRLPDQDMVTLLLIETADRQVIALVADQVLQEQELAIKPFGTAIAAPSYFYGCTIMGSGLLVPVLDVQALMRPETMTVPILPTAAQSIEAQSFEASRDRSTMTGVAVDRTPVVLVVDDSLTTRQTLALTLQKAGYRVLQAKDGREGLEQVEREPDIKAVFSDVEMPRMNGFEFLGQCRQKYTKAQLPIIMLTSRGGDKHRQIAQYMGANDYLTKPYLAVDILRCLDAALALSGAAAP